MTTSDQEEQAERRRVLLQDADLRQQQQEQAQREQVSTFFSHTHADEINGGGRFAAVSPASIVGSEPAVKYPAASPSWQIQLPDEPPLSAYENPALEDPTGVSPPVATDDPAHAPSGGSSPASSYGGLVSERAGSSPSNQQSDGER
jgi:hypothetical protein